MLTTESGTKAWFIPRKTPANTPAIGFGVQPNMRGVADVNPGNGNLTYTAHDLSVQALGGPLEEIRTYNSSSTTVAGFGPGWTSTWEYTLANQAAGISITRPDGSVLFYGRNGDGSLAPAFADGSTVAANPSAPAGIISPAWGVTDHDRTVFYFNTAGAFLGAKDINGRVTTMTTGGNTQTVTDVASGRQLFIDWSNTPGASSSRIVATRTVPIAAHASTAIQWRYYYDASSRLIQACDPRNNAQTTGYCTVYTYDSSNRVTSVVLPKGNTQIAVTYQADGKVATRKDGFNKTWTFAYSTNVSFTNLQGQSVVAARRTTVTDPLNHSDVYDYDIGIRVMHYDNLSGLADFVTYDTNGFVDIESEDNTPHPERRNRQHLQLAKPTTHQRHHHQHLDTTRLNPPGLRGGSLPLNQGESHVIEEAFAEDAAVHGAAEGTGGAAGPVGP